MEMSKNDDYLTRKLLEFSYHQNYYKLIGIDLSEGTNPSIAQEIRFTKKLEERDCTKMFLLLKSSKKL